MKRWIQSVGVVCLAACLTNCSANNRLEIIPVTGELTVDGTAAGPLLLTLTPTSNDTPTVMGQVAEDGSFRLTTRTEGDGAPAGTYEVLLGPDPKQPITVPDVQPTRVTISQPAQGAALTLKISLQSKEATE